MASGGDDWCTIESDPGVFTELLEELGCTNVQLEELWSLDDDTLGALKDHGGAIFGLIFLFQWQNSQTNAATSPAAKTCLSEDQIPEGLFFAHQVTTNACATQAILSVVLNIDSDGEDANANANDDSKSKSKSKPAEEQLGTTLSEFRDFTASFPPSLKGVAISSSEPIKKAHNAFGRTDAFLNDGKYLSPDLREPEDVFHFVAYIPKNGSVYELDGLQSGPIVVGDYDKTQTDNWVTVARDAIQQRMTGDAIKFNLMAVIQDKRIGLREQLSSSTTESSTTSNESLAIQLEMEEQKRKQWKLENQRRRHNYVPLCVSLLKEFAKAGTLPEMVEQAKACKRQKLLAAKNKK